VVTPLADARRRTTALTLDGKKMSFEKITLILGVLVFLGYFLVSTVFLSHWLKCFTSGCPVKLVELMSLRIRKIPLGLLTDSYIIAQKKRVPITFLELAEKYQEDPAGFKDYLKIACEVTEEENIQPVAGADQTR